MKIIFDWKELVSIARERSPFYADLYSNLNGFAKLSDLPIVDQDKFWSANTVKNNRLLTAPLQDGIVFKSGGTTGQPKFSAYTRHEWETFTTIFGEGLCKAGLTAGDRFANLFYAGELYASFVFIMRSLEAANVPAVQFPIAGATDPKIVLKTIDDFSINVVAGLPTTIMNVAEYYAEHRQNFPGICIDKIFFGGESMYADQRNRLHTIFPGVKISSIGYASVDAGLLGYADNTCAPDEHRMFGSASVLEIIDEETGLSIEEIDRPGKLLITNLTRSLNPIIRYPVGDRACWKEVSANNPDRKFVILGRSEEAARVGPVSIYYDDVRSFLSNPDLGLEMTAFQLITRHFELKDALIARIAASSIVRFDTDAMTEKITALFHEQRPMFGAAVNQSIIHPLKIEWTHADEMHINPRSGKLRRVIDERC